VAENQAKKSSNSSNKYLKYSGMVFQLLIMLFLLAALGQWLDQKYGPEMPLFTAFLLLFGIIAYLVKVYFDLVNEN